MEWNEKMRNIIDYVEINLQQREEMIDQEKIAQMAECSYPFFQKVFSYMNNISFAEYIRCRKLTLAGYDLKSTSLKVVDISYKYGYDSPTSFTKAFRHFHGFSPKEARNSNRKLRIFPKMQIQSRQEYAWSFIKKPAFRLLGVTIELKEDRKSAIPAFWNQCQRDGSFAQLISLDEAERKGLFGLFWRNDEEQDVYSIMALSSQPLPKGYDEVWIPSSTWALFDCKGPVPKAIQDGWKYLHTEWVNAYPFAHNECPELEWYSDQNAYDEHYESQIWIPIKEVEDER